MAKLLLPTDLELAIERVLVEFIPTELRFQLSRKLMSGMRPECLLAFCRSQTTRTIHPGRSSLYDAIVEYVRIFEVNVTRRDCQ
jgi:hypothetical protein